MNTEALSILDDIAASAPNRLRPNQTFRVRVGLSGLTAWQAG